MSGTRGIVSGTRGIVLRDSDSKGVAESNCFGVLSKGAIFSKVGSQNVIFGFLPRGEGGLLNIKVRYGCAGPGISYFRGQLLPGH